MLSVELLCNVKTHGVIYKAGFQEIEKKVAEQLIKDGLAVKGTKPESKPIDPVKAQTAAKTKAEKEKEGGA